MAVPATLTLVLATGSPAYANVTVTQVSQDVFTDTQAQHNTEVEPDTFASGSTIVSAFQVGRVSGGGSSDIGWATSTDGGATWTHGYLPGITTNVGGSFGQASDASVAFDAKHNVWLISSLGISGSTVDVLTSRSTDGGLTWSNPVITATGSNDKNWIACDGNSSSPHFGNCYTEYDVTSAGDSIRMRTSTDGGGTWGAALAPGGSHTGLGGQPVVVPNGDVVVPYESLNSLTYYYYPAANCTSSTCQLDVGFISSVNGGTSWSTATQLAGPMTLSWLPNTSQGRMFGDYISTSVLSGGNAYPILSSAEAPAGSTFNQAMFVPSGGLAVTGGTNTAAASRVYARTAGAPSTATVPLTAR